jgi:hypothetical protein
MFPLEGRLNWIMYSYRKRDIGKSKDKTVPVTRRKGPQGGDVEAPKFSRKSAHRLSALHIGRHLLPERFLLPISVKSWFSLTAIVRLEWLGKLKIVMTTSGTELITFRLLAYCLIQLRYWNHIIYSCSRKSYDSLGREIFINI